MGVSVSQSSLQINDIQKAISMFGYEELMADGAISASTWSQVTANGGTIAAYYGIFKLSTSANAAGNANASTLRYFPTSGLLGSSIAYPFKKFSVQMFCKFVTIASVDTATTFIGTGTGAANGNRTSNNIAGFYVTAGGSWGCLTDVGGVEETTDSGVAIGTSYALLKIEYVYGFIKYYINGSLIATHTTHTAFPYILFNLDNNAGVDVSIYAALINGWYE